jgi:hypothetical protein
VELKGSDMALRAVFETRDKQLIPLDDIQHINARPNEAFREGFETLTVMYKDGMKVTIAASEYAALKSAWEARRNGR